MSGILQYGKPEAEVVKADTIIEWYRLLKQARKLDNAEIGKNAQTAKDNRHYCHECFLCACVHVQRERQIERNIRQGRSY